MSLPDGMREALEAVRDMGYGLVMTEDRIFFDGLGIKESVEYTRGPNNDGTFDELRALVADVFQQKRRGST